MQNVNMLQKRIKRTRCVFILNELYNIVEFLIKKEKHVDKERVVMCYAINCYSTTVKLFYQIYFCQKLKYCINIYVLIDH